MTPPAPSGATAGSVCTLVSAQTATPCGVQSGVQAALTRCAYTSYAWLPIERPSDYAWIAPCAPSEVRTGVLCSPGRLHTATLPGVQNRAPAPFRGRTYTSKLGSVRLSSPATITPFAPSARTDGAC